MRLKDKRIVVIGLGKSGFAAAKFLKVKKARPSVTDGSANPEVLKNAWALRKLKVPVETGGHTASFIEEAELVVTSPGVPKRSFPLLLAKKKKIPVISEVELASYFCRGTVVAVTGSNGKTTTSHLISRSLAAAGRPNVLCGNVGHAFLDLIPKIKKKTVVVLELSSFQLEDSPSFRPKIAVVLNIGRNHLDRHGTFQKYIQAKERIFSNQRREDFTILNHDDPWVRRMAEKTQGQVIFFSKKPLSKGVYLKNGQIIANLRNRNPLLIRTGNFRLKGAHNSENILAAVAVAAILGLPQEKLQRSLDRFETLEHRIEPLGGCGGVQFVNDSKSTTVESTKAAILSFSAPIILIAGGKDKGADFGGLEPLLKDRVKQVILYGEAREKIAEAWKSYRSCQMTERFEEAVRLAYESAGPGDAVLLSPMCTSFDQFGSFEERGEAFKEIVRKLKRTGENQWNP